MSLGFLVTIDNIFASKCLPKEAIDNAEWVNANGYLRMGVDQNTSRELWERFKTLWRHEKMHMGVKVTSYFDILFSIVINIWYHCLNNLSKVIFNYFGGVGVLVM